MLTRSEEILKTLRATPVVLRALVGGIDDGGLRRRPAPGEWAIIEVVAHMADTEQHALSRVRRMAAEASPIAGHSPRARSAVRRAGFSLPG